MINNLDAIWVVRVSDSDNEADNCSILLFNKEPTIEQIAASYFENYNEINKDDIEYCLAGITIWKSNIVDIESIDLTNTSNFDLSSVKADNLGDISTE